MWVEDTQSLAVNTEGGGCDMIEEGGGGERGGGEEREWPTRAESRETTSEGGTAAGVRESYVRRDTAHLSCVMTTRNHARVAMPRCCGAWAMVD